MYTKIRIEEILFGFSYSVNSIVSLILLYKQNQKIPKERQGSTHSSTVSTLHQSGYQNINKSPPQFNIPQSIENWSNFESGKLELFITLHVMIRFFFFNKKYFNISSLIFESIYARSLQTERSGR